MNRGHPSHCKAIPGHPDPICSVCSPPLPGGTCRDCGADCHWTMTRCLACIAADKARMIRARRATAPCGDPVCLGRCDTCVSIEQAHDSEEEP